MIGVITTLSGHCRKKYRAVKTEGKRTLEIVDKSSIRREGRIIRLSDCLYVSMEQLLRCLFGNVCQVCARFFSSLAVRLCVLLTNIGL